MAIAQNILYGPRESIARLRPGAILARGAVTANPLPNLADIVRADRFPPSAQYPRSRTLFGRRAPCHAMA